MLTQPGAEPKVRPLAGADQPVTKHGEAGSVLDWRKVTVTNGGTRASRSKLLDPHGPVDSLATAQVAVDTWRLEYNTAGLWLPPTWRPPAQAPTGQPPHPQSS